MSDDLKTRVEARVKYLQHMKEIIPGNTIDVDVKLYYDLYSEIGALRTEDSFKHKVLEAAFSDLNKFRSIAVATDAELKQEKAWRSSDNKSLVKEIKDFQEENQRLEQENAALRDGKNYAYYERNQLVAALTKIFPAWIERHPDADKTWDNDWRNIIFISLPTGQASWHIHDSEFDNFQHLPTSAQGVQSWDGHTNEEKYERLSHLEQALAAKGGEDE